MTDSIAVAGKTFRYTENGLVGLAGGNCIIVASTRNGVYSGDAPAAFLDHQKTYLRGLFDFLGINDVVFVRAEGLSSGEEARQAALGTAFTNLNL